MIISVAMTTYNGEEFIEKQLNSILNQSRIPDELIIVDDLSSDNTWKILNEYKIKNEHKINIFLKKNKKNLGYNKNFINCSKMCKGDIILFSDQDDIWERKKISTIESIFNNHQDAITVMSNTTLIDEKDQLIKSKLFRFSSVGKKVSNKNFIKQSKDFYSSGMSLAIKKQYLEKYQRVIEIEGLFFDTPLGLFSSLENGLYFVKDPLTLHRIHGNNTSKPVLNKISNIHDAKRIINSRQARIKHLKACLLPEFHSYLSKSDFYLLRKEIKNLEKSIYFVEHTSFILLLKIMKNINKFSNYKLYFQLSLFYFNAKFNFLRGSKW